MYIGCFPVDSDPGPVQTDVSITGNTVKGATSSEGFAQGIRVGHTTQLGLEDFTVTQNTVNDCDEGITVRADASGVAVNNNDITGNTWGIQNYDTGIELDGEDNWWGTASGPIHADNTFNVGSQGDASSDDVDYVPWLDDVYATGASFAPVNSEDGMFSSIQAAIVAATSTTVTCAAGSYTEDLYINRSITVQSEDGAIAEEGGEWEVATELVGYVEINLGWGSATPLAETAVFDGFYIGTQVTPIHIADVDNGSDLTIRNNVLEGLGESAKGIYSVGDTVNNASSVTIEGNYIFECSDSGIYFEEVAGGSEVTIEDNVVAENGYGIEFVDVDESTVTIAGNTIGEGYCEVWDFYYNANSNDGIYFGGMQTVSGSTITIGGETRAEGNVIDNNSGDGISVSSMIASSLEILNNDILDNNYDGVEIGSFDEDSTVDIHYNSIDDNSSYGVQYDSPYTVNATCNWWGDVAGPSIGTNPHSAWTNGDSVTSYVDYIPWLIQSELDEDWNIWSAPIAADGDSWEQMQAELVEDGIESICYFDSATQLWGDADDAGALDAYYIKMPADSRVRYCINDEVTYPGQKAMKVGWNFVGLADLHNKLNLPYALSDAYWGTGQTGLFGYNRVISPTLNGESWTYVRDDGVKLLYPTKGYWVFMVNDGMLGGFTSTPIVEVENGPQ